MVTKTRIKQGWNILSYILMSGKPLLMRDLVDLLYRKYDYSKATARRILNRDILNGFLIKENLVTIHRKGKYSFVDLTGKGLAYSYNLIIDKDAALFYLESRYGLHGLLYLKRIFDNLYAREKIEEALAEHPINVYSEEINRVEEKIEMLCEQDIEFDDIAHNTFSDMTMLEGIKYVMSSRFSYFISRVLDLSYEYNTVLMSDPLHEINEPDYIHEVLNRAINHIRKADKVTFACINCLLLKQLAKHAKGLWSLYILKNNRKFVSNLNEKLKIKAGKICTKSDELLKERIQNRLNEYYNYFYWLRGA